MNSLQSLKEHSPGVLFLLTYSSIIGFTEFASTPPKILLFGILLPVISVVGISEAVTSYLIKEFYEPVGVESYLEALDIVSEDEEALQEIDDRAILDQLPHDSEDVVSVSETNVELFNKVPGEVYDPIDKRIRGEVTTLICCLLIGLSAPVVGHFYYNQIIALGGILLTILALATALHYYNDLIEIIQYSPKRVKHEN
ncbi:hypothetical protein HZS55_20390 [Halosimplex rubrum]|uniref:Uncharacterized protein n=1 Tax=Halosimplex rubrum TaxID=869889 RepID=A0A7D5T6I9_9EURY|nr:hypothetical protein [Halosimplex rubrum]QLH79510.1 hypothetical protein HZS55_20390 [Halosimplex rubrum]